MKPNSNLNHFHQILFHSILPPLDQYNLFCLTKNGRKNRSSGAKSVLIRRAGATIYSPGYTRTVGGRRGLLYISMVPTLQRGRKRGSRPRRVHAHTTKQTQSVSFPETHSIFSCGRLFHVIDYLLSRLSMFNPFFLNVIVSIYLI